MDARGQRKGGDALLLPRVGGKSLWLDMHSMAVRHIYGVDFDQHVKFGAPKPFWRGGDRTAGGGRGLGAGGGRCAEGQGKAGQGRDQNSHGSSSCGAWNRQ